MFLIYNDADFQAGTFEGSIWNKKTLIAIRETERPIKESYGFKTTCFSKVVEKFDKNGKLLPQ